MSVPDLGMGLNPPVKQCPDCKGAGRSQVMRGMTVRVQECIKCRGTGSIKDLQKQVAPSTVPASMVNQALSDMVQQLDDKKRQAEIRKAMTSMGSQDPLTVDVETMTIRCLVCCGSGSMRPLIDEECIACRGVGRIPAAIHDKIRKRIHASLKEAFLRETAAPTEEPKPKIEKRRGKFDVF